MTNQIIPFGGKARERAVLLLAAAEELGLPVEAVQTRENAFYAPAEVIEKAGLSDSLGGGKDAQEAPEGPEDPEGADGEQADALQAQAEAEQKPAKKTAAKKTTAKKAAAKKTSSKE